MTTNQRCTYVYRARKSFQIHRAHGGGVLCLIQDWRLPPLSLSPSTEIITITQSDALIFFESGAEIKKCRHHRNPFQHCLALPRPRPPPMINRTSTPMAIEQSVLGMIEREEGEEKTLVFTPLCRGNGSEEKRRGRRKEPSWGS